MEYHSLFKCRLCGEKYISGMTANREIALDAVIQVVLGRSVVNGPSLHDVHYCKNGGFGISDFLGFDMKEEE